MKRLTGAFTALLGLLLFAVSAHAIVKNQPPATGGGGGTGTVTSITAGTGLSGGTITTSGTIALSSTTGSGAVVLATSPTLVTPALGTPSALVLTNATALPAAALPALSGDVATAAGSAVTSIQAGAVTLADHANLAANSFIGNVTNSAATPTAVNPLAACNQMGCVVTVYAITTADIALTGIQTIDGQVLVAGEFVLVAKQTTSANDGIYVVAAGAWTRAAAFPAGYVIAQNCMFEVAIANGTANQGHVWWLVATSGAITIGTTAQSWQDRSLGVASSTTPGIVSKVTGAGSAAVASMIVSPTGAGGHAGDCVSFNDVAGSIADTGNFVAGSSTGPCTIADNAGHIAAFPNSAAPPVVTGTGCSLNAAGQDNSGAIVATGVDTCTLTFGVAFDTVPFCSVANVGATVQANLTALPTVAHAIFATVAAGTFSYVCL